MLKPFDELAKVDVSSYCKKRDGIDYLPWPKCYELLYENGAKKVFHEPIINERTGSTLFMTDIAFGEGERANRCYEVRVRITIDEDTFIYNYPLMNGKNPVRDNSMSQLRVNNAHQRAFVKGVAIRTGLGFKLWNEDDLDSSDDLSMHNIVLIKKRVEQTITIKLQNGMSQSDILRGLNMNERAFNSCLEMYGKLASFERALSKL